MSDRRQLVDAAQALAEPVARLGGGFMSDPRTFDQGLALGLARLDFYVGGRGGVLGPVASDVVINAFVWFEPTMIRTHWEAARAARAPGLLAEHWAEQAYGWGRRNLVEAAAARLGFLAAQVATRADPPVAPLFRGWLGLPAPSDPGGAAVHYLYALRELRGALHASALAAQGVTPAQALAIRTPRMARMFGWDELADATAVRPRWEQAEEATNQAMADYLACLSIDERQEFVVVAAAANAAVDW